MKSILSILIVICALQSFAQNGKITVPTGHSVSVERVVVDKKVEFIYTIEEQKIIMWNLKTNEQIYSFQSSFKFGDVVLSNDGKMLAVSNGFDLTIYSTVTGEKIYEEIQSKNPGISRFSDDDKFLYVRKYDNGRIKFSKMDLVSHTLTQVLDYALFKQQPGPSFITENGNSLIVGQDGYDVLNTKTAAIISTMNFPVTYQETVGYIPEQNLLITTRNQSSTRDFTFINVATGTVIKTMSIRPSTSRILISNDKTTFILDSTDIDDPNKMGNLVVYSTQTLEPIRKIPVNKSQINKMLYFNEGKNVLVARDDAGVNFLNGKNGRLEHKYKQNNSSISIGNITASSKLNDNNFPPLLNVATDSALVKIDLLRMAAINKKPFIHPLTNGVFSDARIAYSVTGDTVAIVTMKNIQIKNLITNKLIRPQINVGGEINLMPYSQDIFFSSDGKYLYYNVYELKPATGTFFYKVALESGLTVKLKIPEILNTVLNKSKNLMAGSRLIPGNEKEILVWDFNADKAVFTLPVPPLEQNGQKNSQSLQVIDFAKNDQELIIKRTGYFEWYDLRTKDKIQESKEIGSSGKELYYSNNGGSEIIMTQNDGGIAAYKPDGNLMYARKAHAGLIPFVSFSPDDKLLYTNGEDQTIKVWRAATGELLGTFYLFNEGADYVFLGVDGRFDGTAAGMKQLYYIKNRQKISLDKVYERYYTPNLYQRLVNGEIFTPIPTDNLKNAPKVKIGYAEATRNLDVEDDVPTYLNKTGFADIVVSATSEDDAIDEIRLFHNGKIVTLTTRNLIVADDAGNSQTKKYQLALLPGNNNIRAIALNTQRTESDPDQIIVSYAGNGNAPSPEPKPNNNSKAPLSLVDKNATMYLMVVGINAYTNKINPLTYALPDATAFKEEIEKDAKTILANVKTYFIADAKADKAGIVNAFNEIKRNAKPQDVLVFYYAGHGYIEPTSKEFYLVSSDVTDAGASLLKNGIPASELQQYAVEIQAQKQLFVLDACQSAGAFDAMLKHDGEQQKSLAVVARSTGTHWMAASGSLETAKEFAELGHGAFTYVLLQALKGQAAANKMITINGLKNFLQVQVPELVKKYGGNNQYPASYGQGNDFPVEIVK